MTAQIAGLLDSPEIAALVSELEATRGTGRPDYPICTMVGMMLAKALHVLPTWTRTAALAREHAALQVALGCESEADVPNVDACSRFTRKLRAHKALLNTCIEHVVSSVHSNLPQMGRDVAIDGSDFPAHSNDQRFLSKNGSQRKPVLRP